jgi:hypothetical protein
MRNSITLIVCRLIVVRLPMMSACETRTHEASSASASARFGCNADCHRRSWLRRPTCTATTWAGWSGASETLACSISSSSRTASALNLPDSSKTFDSAASRPTKNPCQSTGLSRGFGWTFMPQSDGAPTDQRCQARGQLLAGIGQKRAAARFQPCAGR